MRNLRHQWPRSCLILVNSRQQFVDTCHAFLKLFQHVAALFCNDDACLLLRMMTAQRPRGWGMPSGAHKLQLNPSSLCCSLRLAPENSLQGRLNGFTAAPSTEDHARQVPCNAVALAIVNLSTSHVHVATQTAHMVNTDTRYKMFDSNSIDSSITRMVYSSITR